MRFLAFILIALSTYGATWYVRPLVYTTWSGGHPVPTAGIYGSQDGTTYANAWNGLNSVVWGVSGVNSGDTLYICGKHLAVYNALQGPNTTSFKLNLTQSGVTLRGDYPGDAGLVFGGCLDQFNTYNWVGPDANGVYASAFPSLGNASWATQFEITNGMPYRMKQESATTWVGDNGSCYFIQNASNYVKLSDGSAPTSSKVALQQFGWIFYITNGYSNITFQSMQFIDGGIGWPYGDTSTGVVALTFTNCTLTDGSCSQGNSYFHVRAGHDNWKIINCEIARCGEGIEADLQALSRGAWGWTVFGNYIHDVNTKEFPTAADPHAIGLQGVCNWNIVSNRTERTGAAIELFTGSQAQSNNLIAYNFIKTVYVQTNGTGGGGIVITPPSATFGVSNRIYGNVIFNVGLLPDDTNSDWEGAGIDVGSPDYIVICNNTIVNPRIGLQLRSASSSLAGKVENNIVVNPSRNLINFAQQGVGTIVMDYNLFYTNSPLVDPFHNLPAGHDTHSVFSNPLFVSGSPSVATDFALQSGSPARGAGVAVPVAKDFLGKAYASPPSIGAFEFYATAPVANLRVNTLRVGNLISAP